MVSHTSHWLIMTPHPPIGDGWPHAMAWILGCDQSMDLFPSGKCIGMSNHSEVTFYFFHHPWDKCHATSRAYHWQIKIQWWVGIFSERKSPWAMRERYLWRMLTQFCHPFRSQIPSWSMSNSCATFEH